MSNINLYSLKEVELPLYVCSVVDKKNTGPSDHCFDHCGHSEPHYKDECTFIEKCNLHLSEEYINVKCRKLRKKEILKIQGGK